MERVTPVVMHRLIDVMIKYLRRHGMLHFHWIIEFTARRMPHIHMSVWMADRYEEWDRHLRQYIVWDNNESAVVSNVVVKWLELTEAEGLHTSSNSQDVQLIDGNEAWLVYIAKHGIRGVKHYQRALDNMPDEWRDGAGAMWGHDRKMPVADDSVLPMDMRAFHQFRREARKWCCAHACMIKDPHRRAKAIGQARRSNRCCRPELSVVRPVSVWIPKDVTISIVKGLRSRGYMIGWDAYQWGVDELARLRDEGGSEERRRILGKSLMEMLRRELHGDRHPRNPDQRQAHAHCPGASASRASHTRLSTLPSRTATSPPATPAAPPSGYVAPTSTTGWLLCHPTGAETQEDPGEIRGLLVYLRLPFGYP